MLNRVYVVAATVLAVFLAAQGQAAAAVLDFQYGTTITPSPINPTSSVPAQGSIISQSGVGTYPAPSGAVYNAGLNGALGTDVTVGSISVTDLGLGAYTDTYGPTAINVNFALKDVTSGQVGLFAFPGLLTGQVASSGTTSAAAINNPFSSAFQAQTIGAETYVVRIIPSKDFSAPGSPPSGGTGLAGTYSFNVLSRSNFTIPEPASIGLLALGGLLLPLFMARRRATKTAPKS
jgi:hypothetical protein